MDEKELETKIIQFRKQRAKTLGKLYADETATRYRYDNTPSTSKVTVANAAELRKLLSDALTNKERVVSLSQALYATNPIYSAVVNYLSDMFFWRYKVTPHKIYTKSKAQNRKKIDAETYSQIYNYMLEVVDGLGIEIKFPKLLSLLEIQGAVYYTTVVDEESLAVDTLLLPPKYCRKTGETQFGTAIIDFDFSYFNDLGLQEDQLKDYLKGFSKEFTSGYNKYKKDSTQRWQTLDPHFTSGLQLNDQAIPTLVYMYGGILDYEHYQDNELERNDNLLKYLVVQKMPVYQDKLVFEVDEVQALHNSMKKVIDKGEKTRLITTFGDVDLLKVAENETIANEVLEKAFKAVFNNAGFNSGIFTSESVEALKMSLIRDKGMMWKYVAALASFYTMTINNWFDFKNYEANIDILPISPYTYKDDIELYKANASLGVGKLDYIIASGIKQKNIVDSLDLEEFLNLDRITPMQTSYTQTAEDRKAQGNSSNSDETSKKDKTEIEPSENKPTEEESKE